MEQWGLRNILGLYSQLFFGTSLTQNAVPIGGDIIEVYSLFADPSVAV